MTGDGVNDILAMKDADCSVAMASGSEAAAQAAQVVLLDSDFAHMPDVVSEGRQVVNNVQRSASLFLVKNIFSLLMAIFAVVSTILLRGGLCHQLSHCDKDHSLSPSVMHPHGLHDHSFELHPD